MTIPPTLEWPVKFCAFGSLTTYVVSVLTSNVSQVDRLWTFLPTIYAAYYALLPLWPNESALSWVLPYVPESVDQRAIDGYKPRAVLMLSLVVIWMCRLSYNTFRRGLFSLTDEDYRWAVLRSQLHPVLFQITNFFFISWIQNFILFFLGLPILAAVTDYTDYRAPSSLTWTDGALSILALVVIALEFTADNQQYAFHAYKHAALKANGAKAYNEKEQWPGARLAWTERDAQRGFNTRGLWAYSRHPNFACEQSFWWIITLFPMLARPHDPDFATTLARLVPALVLSSLFLASTAYTEAITTPKYSQYKNYQKQVPMFAPFIGPRKLGILHVPRWKEE